MSNFIFTPYIPKTQIEYYENMRNWLILYTSGLTNFNRGSRIRTLLEAISFELAQGDIQTLNGFKSAVIEGNYNTFNFQRKDGNKATGTIIIENSDSISSIVYPVFTLDVFGIQFETIEEVTKGTGVTSVQVGLRAIESGTAGNILPFAIDTDYGRGTVLNTIPAFDRIYNPVEFANGTDEESDSSRLARFQAYIKTLGNKSSPLGIKSTVIDIAGVIDATVINNINPYTGLSETGWCIIYISDGTVSPPQSLIDEVQKTVEGDPLDQENYPGVLASGVKLVVLPIVTTPVDIEYTLVLKTSAPESDIYYKNLVESKAYYYVNNLPVGEDMLVETLKAYMLSASEDLYTIQINLPLTDVSIPSGSVAKVNSIVSLVNPLSKVTPI